MKTTNQDVWTHFSVGTMLCCDFISRSRYHKHLPWTFLRLFRRSCSGKTMDRERGYGHINTIKTVTMITDNATLVREEIRVLYGNDLKRVG